MDNFWIAVIAGSIAVYSWKILGFALPKRFAEKEEVVVFAGKLNIKPKPGMLVMFPGILNHEVPATEGRRVVVAMNLNKRALFQNVQVPA